MKKDTHPTKKQSKFSRFIRRVLRIMLYVHIVFFIIILVFGVYLRKSYLHQTSLMIYRKQVFHHDIKPIIYIPLSKIPAQAIKSVITAEDYNFYSHPGIDIAAIIRAYLTNKRLGYRFHGGSTITQQLSRTLFLVPKKIMLRKYLEMFIALEIDIILPKDRILELYFNSCEWGRGVFGIGQASLHYFGKNLDELSEDEITRLITILPSPIKYGPYTFQDNKLLNNRYVFSKFRDYTFRKFHTSE